jgi:tetratricopeptide (TPR) repeat protein
LNPIFTKEFYERNNCFHRLNKLSEYINAYNKAIRANPLLVDEAVIRGEACSNTNKNKYNELIAINDRVIAVNSKNTMAFYNKAVCLARLYNYEQALVFIKEAIRLECFSYNDTLRKRRLVLFRVFYSALILLNKQKWTCL